MPRAEFIGGVMESSKDLLLKDLCSRLPYGVKCEYCTIEDEIKVGELLTVWCKEKRVFIDKLSIDYDGCDCVGVIPYLFPLSSMTEEQEKEFRYTLSSDYNITYDTVDWLNKNHFDYRNLIDKNLAIDCTNLNIY